MKKIVFPLLIITSFQLHAQNWVLGGNAPATADTLGNKNNQSLHILTNNQTRMFFRNTGEIGVGTSTPNAPLQFANSTSNRKIVFYEAANNDHQFNGFGLNPGILRYQVNQTGDDHVFFAGVSATSSNELMRIKGNGNVGIGTSSPNAALQFSGSVSNRKIVFFEAANNDHQFNGFGLNPGVLRYQVNNTGDDHVFFAGVSATSSNELMRIKGDGTVGIKGALALNGNKGTAGQVLTSKGAGAAEWVTPINVQTIKTSAFTTPVNDGVAKLLATFTLTLSQTSDVIMSANVVYNSLDIATNSFIETFYSVDGSIGYTNWECLIAGFRQTATIANSTVTLNAGPHTIRLFTRRNLIPRLVFISGEYNVWDLDATVLTIPK